MGATVSRARVRLFLLLSVISPAAQAAPAAHVETPIVIAFAEQAARLVRDTSLYRAGRGVVLRENDMLESGAGVIQVAAGGATLALGPASKLYVGNAGQFVLLDGWLKLQGSAGRAITVATAHLQLASSSASVTLRAAAGASELFAESGEVLVHELAAGKRKRGASVPHEHFAVRAGALPLRLAERAPPAFLGAMPPSFRDQLVPLAVSGAPVAPRHERAATFAELSPWLAAHPLLRARVQARFAPVRPARAAPPRPLTARE